MRSLPVVEGRCIILGMDPGLPLTTLLSQALLAFTIEFDNEFEHLMPHRTASGPSIRLGDGPWLVSGAMWWNFMQYVPADGVPLREVEVPARIANLAGLERWRYIVVGHDPADSRPRLPRAEWTVRPTPGGLRAQEVWRPLTDVIEGRWEARFGRDEVDGLRAALS